MNILTKLKGDIDSNITNSRWFQYVTLNNGQNSQTEDKKTEDLKNTINQLDITDIYRTFYLTTDKFFWSTNETFSKIHHMSDHKVSLNRF